MTGNRNGARVRLTARDNFFDFCCLMRGTIFFAWLTFGTPARRADLEWQKDVSLIISALRAHYFAVRQSFGRLRGVRDLLAWRGSDPLIFPPCGHGISPSGEVLDACTTCGLEIAGRNFSNLFCPSGTEFCRLAEFGTPARRAALKSQAEISLIYSARRAHYFAVRQSLGRLRGARTWNGRRMFL